MAAYRIGGLFVVVLVASMLGAVKTGVAEDPLPVSDLTQGGQRDESHDWNLGPTGATGWIWGKDHHSTDSRQILITQVDQGSPADGVLEVGDVILGVGDKPFTADARKEVVEMIHMRSPVSLLCFVHTLARRQHLLALAKPCRLLILLGLSEGILVRITLFVESDCDIGPGHIHRAFIADEPQVGAARCTVNKIAAEREVKRRVGFRFRIVEHAQHDIRGISAILPKP